MHYAFHHRRGAVSGGIGHARPCLQRDGMHLVLAQHNYDPIVSDSNLHSRMDSLFAQVSGLAGVLVLLHQLWSYAPIERTVYASVGTAIAMYLVLVVGHTVVRQILSYQPPQLAEDRAGAKESNASSSSEPASAESGSESPSA